VLWGDHGWHLGEHRIFGKHTSFEKALKSVLIMRTPGMKKPGRPTDALVQSIDIYPTLAKLLRIDSSQGYQRKNLYRFTQQSQPARSGICI
jgi:arylsulfatase A-like enzyme